MSDFLYQEAFLATYRTFMDPPQLIKKLLYRYSTLSRSSDGQKRKLANNTFSLLVRVVNELWSVYWLLAVVVIVVVVVSLFVTANVTISKYVFHYTTKPARPTQHGHSSIDRYNKY